MKTRHNRIWAALLLLAALLVSTLSPALAEEHMPQVADVARKSVHIRAVGDLMMHQRQLDLAWREGGAYDFDPQYALVKDSLSDADYTIANLETTIGLYGNQPYSGYPRFNAPESLLDTIRAAGVDFLTLANNHMLDRYFEGMLTTVERVDQWGFDHGGAYRTPKEAATPVAVEVNGVKIGFLCYTAHTNGMERYCDAGATEYGISYPKDADFAADVEALRAAGAEFIVCLPHWGTEYQRRPDADVRQTALKMAEAGVDVILGSHPHMVQPMEWLEVDTPQGARRTLVAWSMGSFISNMKIQYTDSGVIVDFTIVEQPDGSYAVEDVGYVPIYCWRQENCIQALCSGEYLETPPSGMADSTWARLKKSHAELVELMGDEFRLLEK